MLAVSNVPSPASTQYAGDPTPEELAANRVRLRVPLEVDAEAGYEAKEAEVMRVCEIAFSKTGKWVVLYRTLMGVDGTVMTLFPESAERQKFFRSNVHAEMQEMIAAMRSTDSSKSDATEPERMITIRIPMTLHEVLKAESKWADLSINQLCISKLIQPLQDRHVPEPQGRRRGRRPGPQGPRK